MKRSALVLALASLVSVCQAEDADFARLQKSYQAAIQKANEPINRTYVAELRKLLEKQTKAGSLAEAQVTMDEIAAVMGGKGGDTAPTTSDKEFEKFVIGTTWKHTMGSTVTFKKGGEGVKEDGNQSWPLVWRIQPPNIVEATGNLNPDGSRRTFYYRIISKKEAYYGNSLDATTMPLVYVR